MNLKYKIIIVIILSLIIGEDSFAVPKTLSDRCESFGLIMTQSGRKLDGPYPKPNKYYYVTNVRQIMNLKKVRDPDVPIVFAPGQYPIKRLVFNKPVHLMSEISGQAVFPRGALLEINGSNSRVEGFRFEDGAPVHWVNSRHHSLYVRGENTVITNNLFYNVGAGSTIPDKTGITIEIIKAQNVQILHNQFIKNRGVAIKTDDFSTGLIVSHNNFLDSPKYEGVGEIVHLGDALSITQAVSPQSDNLKARVEYNYVRNWQLESELISIKSNQNIIRYNFVEKSGSSAFVVRMGNKNEIYGNYIRDNIGFPIRISGERNTIHNNLMSGKGSMLFLHDESTYKNSKPPLFNAYWAANDNNISNNIFIGHNRVLGRKDNKYIVLSPPRDNMVSQNIIATKDTTSLSRQLASFDAIDARDNSIIPISDNPCHALEKLNRL